jgi:hypothetical protein
MRRRSHSTVFLPQLTRCGPSPGYLDGNQQSKDRSSSGWQPGTDRSAQSATARTGSATEVQSQRALRRPRLLRDDETLPVSGQLCGRSRCPGWFDRDCGRALSDEGRAARRLWALTSPFGHGQDDTVSPGKNGFGSPSSCLGEKSCPATADRPCITGHQPFPRLLWLRSQSAQSCTGPRLRMPRESGSRRRVTVCHVDAARSR